jgi:hypothetical protein
MDDTTKKSIFDETEEEEKSSWPFDNLPKDIRDWLRSLTVQNEIDRINRQLSDQALDEQGISSTLSKLVLGKIRANQFVSTLISEHSATPEIAKEIAKEVEKKILLQIKFAMREELGVAIEQITQEPKVEQTARKPATARPVMVDIRPAAKTTELQKSAPNAEPVKVSVQTPTPKKPTYPGAGTLKTDKPIGLSEILPTPPKPHELEKYEDTHPVIE